MGARGSLRPGSRSRRQGHRRAHEGRFLLQLAEQGKLGLDDPIGKFIDGVPQGDKITLRQLACMRSGLENYAHATAFQQALVADPYRNFTPQELLGYAFAEPMPFSPGEAYEYSNTNTVLLGLVVEKLSRQSLPDYIKDHILTPLGMDHTSFPTTNAFPEPHAQGYTAITKVLSPDHVYTIGAGVQQPSATPSPAPTTKPR